MSRDSEFAIESSLSQEGFLRALAAVGHEWRESAQPAAARSVHAYAVKVRIKDRRFSVQLVGTANRAPPVCFGTVFPAESGSRIEARIGSSLATRITYGVAIAWFATLAIVVAISAHSPLPLVPGVAFVAFIISDALASTEEDNALRTLIADLATEQRASGASRSSPPA
jgi:hypothetical protein